MNGHGTGIDEVLFQNASKFEMGINFFGIRGNRQKALEAVKRNAVCVWSALLESRQRDKEFILRAMHCSHCLPPNAELERKLSQSLQFDIDVVLGFCQ